MTTETKLIIERRASGSSKWDYYCPCTDLTEEQAIAEAERLAAKYEYFHFRAVREVSTREVLRKK